MNEFYQEFFSASMFCLNTTVWGWLKSGLYHVTSASYLEYIAPNVALDRLTILLHITEVLGSNLGPEAGYPEKFFYTLVPSDNNHGDNLNWAMRAPSASFPIHYLLVILSFDAV
jgi:hypothetical protein